MGSSRSPIILGRTADAAEVSEAVDPVVTSVATSVVAAASFAVISGDVLAVAGVMISVVISAADVDVVVISVKANPPLEPSKQRRTPQLLESHGFPVSL